MSLTYRQRSETANKAMHLTSARCRQFQHTPLAYRFGGNIKCVARREERAKAGDCQRSAFTRLTKGGDTNEIWGKKCHQGKSEVSKKR